MAPQPPLVEVILKFQIGNVAVPYTLRFQRNDGRLDRSIPSSCVNILCRPLVPRERSNIFICFWGAPDPPPILMPFWSFLIQLQERPHSHTPLTHPPQDHHLIFERSPSTFEK